MEVEIGSTILKEMKKEVEQNQEIKTEPSAVPSTMFPPSEELRPADHDGSVLSDASSSVESVSGYDLGKENSLITKEMVVEEQKLHENTIKQEEQMKRRSRMEMNIESAECRYEKLKSLLGKSQMYSTYLLNRMQKQKIENDKKQERLMKRAAREAEKKAKEEELSAKKKEEKAEDDSERVKESKAAPEEVATGRDLRVRSENSQNSQGSQTRNKKRKAEGESPKTIKVADFFTPKKRRKVKTDEENEKPKVPHNGVNDKIITAKPTTEHVRYVKGKRMYKDEVVPKEQPNLFVGGILRQYQVEGFNWLMGLYENGVNGILADEMGLGKTIQCISLVAHLVDEGVTGPFLVCAPLSTIPNWVSEFKRFAPKVPVILYHGSKDERHKLRRKMRLLHPVRHAISAFPVVVTSYEIIMNDRQYIMNNNWKLLIVDEGHRIKNFQCRLIQELKMYQSTHRLLLTGTPLQNNLTELWSLLNFLLPEIFDDLGSFQAWFDLNTLQSSACHQEIIQEERKNNVLNMLHQILTPFMLRRLKSDIDLCIPPKREVLVYAPLTKKQKEMYKAVADKTIRTLMGCDEEEEQKKEVVKLDKKGRPVRKSCGIVNYASLMDTETKNKEGSSKKKTRRPDDSDDDDLDSWVQEVAKQQQIRSQWGQLAKSGQSSGPKGAVINIQLRNAMALLRKVCNHPYLIEYPLTKTGEYKIDQDIVNVSGKFLLLDKMLPELKRRGHKVLIFSQMTSTLDILGDYCHLRDWRCCRLDGSMNINDRRAQIDDFNNDPDIFVFMLSTRAGGLGINLTAADTCIIFDSDWNPQCDLQAQDRCHRIGQTKPVLIYRLVTANTIDQKIVERAAAKRKLEKMVIHKGQFKKGMELNAKPISVITAEELTDLLQEVDYDEVIDKSVISSADLFSLLDRSDLLERMKRNKVLVDKEKEALRVKLTSEPGDKMVKAVKGVFKIIDEDLGSTGEKSDSVLRSVRAEDTILGAQGMNVVAKETEAVSTVASKDNNATGTDHQLTDSKSGNTANITDKSSDDVMETTNNNKANELDQELTDSKKCRKNEKI